MSAEQRLITRPKIDTRLVLRERQSFIEYLERFLGVPTSPHSTVLLGGFCQTLIRTMLATDAEPEDVWRYVKLAAEAFAALFIMESSGGNGFFLLGDRRITFDESADESELYVGNWKTAISLAFITRRRDFVDEVCNVPTRTLRKSSTQGSAFWFHYVDALRATCRNKSAAARRALKLAADSASSEIPEWVEPIVVQKLAIPLFSVVGDIVDLKQEAINSDIELALRAFKEFWTSTKKRREDFAGYVPFEILGLAALAHDRGLVITVESDYLPLYLVRGEGLAW